MKHIIQSTKWLPVETIAAVAAGGVVEVDGSAGIPRDLYHQSGHCLSFPPPGQKQFSMCPTLLAALQMGFTQMTFDFGLAIKALTEVPGRIKELSADFRVVSSASICSVI